MPKLLVLLTIVFWLFQSAATAAGIREWSGLPVIAAALIALVIAAVPLLGTVLAVLGALYAWNWDVALAVLAFLGPLVVIAMAGVLAVFSIWDALSSMRAFWPRRT